MAMAMVSSSDGRMFMPKTEPKEVIATCSKEMSELSETLIMRIWTAPAHAYAESEDVWHIWTDGKAAAEKSVASLKKQLVRDTFKMGGLGFLGAPYTGIAAPRVLLMESYIWTSLCVLGYMLGVVVGGFDPLMSLFRPIFHPINALVVIIFLPFWVQSRLRKSYLPEEEQRSICFYNSVLLGLLASYSLGTPSTNFAQFLALVPLWMGIVSGLHEFYPLCRPHFLAATIGAPFAIYVLYIVLAGPKCAVLFLLAWTALCAAVAVELQLKLGRLRRGWAGKELEQWGTVVVMITAHFVISHLLAKLGAKW